MVILIGSNLHHFSLVYRDGHDPIARVVFVVLASVFAVGSQSCRKAINEANRIVTLDFNVIVRH